MCSASDLRKVSQHDCRTCSPRPGHRYHAVCVLLAPLSQVARSDNRLCMISACFMNVPHANAEAASSPL